MPESASTTRRTMLKGLTLLAGALTPTALSATRLPPLKVALLLPEQSTQPDLPSTIETHLTQALRDRATVIVTRTGRRPMQIERAAQTALTARPDLLIAVGDGMGDSLRAPLLSQPAAVIHLTAGSLLPDAADRAPLGLTVSLRSWEAEWAMGHHLARERQDVHLLLSQHDSGYDLPFAFSAGMQAGRGTQRGTTVFDPHRADPNTLIQAARASGARHVHVQASGSGEQTLRALQRAGFSVSVSGLTAPDGTWTRALAAPDHPAVHLARQAADWITSLPTDLVRHPATLHAALVGTTVKRAVSRQGPLSPINSQGHMLSPILLHRPGQPTRELSAPMATQPELQRHGPRSGSATPDLYA